MGKDIDLNASAAQASLVFPLNTCVRFRSTIWPVEVFGCFLEVFGSFLCLQTEPFK